MLRFLLILLLLPTIAFSEEIRPTGAEHKAETAQTNNHEGNGSQQITVPANSLSPTIINISTGKHAGEESPCTKPKDWKEWGSFAWCQFMGWIDAEKTIAAFTVILGIATGLLWWVTRGLVKGAERTERRQLRAYVGMESLNFECANLKEKHYKPADLTTIGLIHKDFLVVKVRNFGQTPAYGVTVYAYPVATDYSIRLPDDFFEQNDTADVISMAEVRPTLARFMLHRDQTELLKHALIDITDIRDAIAKKRTIHVFGRIYYRDIYGRPWRTKFCYTWEPWHPGGSRFVAYEEYNEEDQVPLEEWRPGRPKVTK